MRRCGSSIGRVWDYLEDELGVPLSKKCIMMQPNNINLL